MLINILMVIIISALVILGALVSICNYHYRMVKAQGVYREQIAAVKKLYYSIFFDIAVWIWLVYYAIRGVDFSGML